MNKEQTGETVSQTDSPSPAGHPPRVMIAIPTRGDIRPETALWLVHAVAEGPELGYQATPDIYVGPWPVDCMRNWLVRKFLESDNEYLSFVDSDCEPEPGTIRRLLDHDKDIVASVCPGNVRRDDGSGDMVVHLAFFTDWSTPSARTIALPPDAAWLPDGLMEVDAVGGSGVLIKRHVLETMGYPWFQFVFDPENGTALCGEDIFFCLKAKENGFKVWADFGCVQKHYKTAPLVPGMMFSSLVT